MTLLNTLLVRVKRAIPLQLLQADRFPRCCKPQDQTGLPVFKNVLGYPDFPEKLREDRESQRFFGSTRVALMPSAPGVLPFFILLMALLISSIHGKSVFMSMCCVTARICAVF